MRQLFKYRWIFIVAILAVAAFFGWRYISRTKTAKAAAYVVRRQDLSETLSFSGEVDALEKVTLRFPASGRLVWVGVKSGDYVKKYQTLASLDQREVRANLKKYLNTYMTERWNFEADKTNYDAKLTDDLKKTLEKAQFDLNSAVLDVEIKNLAVEYASLWSPIEGLLVTQNVPVAGTNVTPTQAEFQIVNPKTVYFSAAADQADIVKLAAGQNGEITLDAYPDQPVKSAISSIAFTPKSGETGTVYEVKMALPVDNSQYRYRLGMTGDANFIIREIPNALAIPTKIIKSNSDGTKFVWLNNKDQRVKRVIAVGDSFDSLTEIKSGLSENDLVYTQ